MSKINGTDLMLYCDGVVIAAQRGGTLSIEQNLIPTTNKGSSGWAEHINGQRSATIDFDGLYSTTGLSAEALIGYITGRTNIEVIFFPTTTGTYHWRGMADPTSISMDAPLEDAISISGSFTINGELYQNAAGTAGIIAGVDTSDDDVYRSLDRGETFTAVEAGTALSACCDRLGRYYFYLTAGQIVKWDYSNSASTNEQAITGEAADRIRCSYTGQYVLAFEDSDLYYSSDYGANFTSKATATVIDCDVASTGVYQAYCIATQIYRSINSGSSFASLVYPGAASIEHCGINDAGNVLITDSDNGAYLYNGTSWETVEAMGADVKDCCINDTYGLVATATDLQKIVISGTTWSDVSTDPFTLVTTDKNGTTAFATDGATIYIYDGTTLTEKGTEDLSDIFTP